MDASSSNPTIKRRRTEADTAESDSTCLPDNAVERSAQFWFDDGNVVLQAEGTRFRVHRSILSHHSSVMKDCFKCPQPEDTPTVEGCPLVHLQDAAKDISNMCSLLYGMYLVDVKTITSAVLVSMLLMGRKYEIASFTTAAMGILEQLFPPTLEEWETSQAQVRKKISQNAGFLFDLLNLACEFPLPSIVRPLLISVCTIFPLDAIKSGIPGNATLNPSAKQYCVLGRMILTQLALQIFMRLHCGLDSVNTSTVRYTIPTRSCETRVTCLTDMRDIIVELVLVSGTTNVVSFLPPASRPTTNHGARHRLCSACFDQFKESKIDARKYVWDELPGALKALDTQ